VYVVTRGHFRSRDKDGGLTIRTVIAENLMLHANAMDLCFIEPKLLPIDKFYFAEIGILDHFCSCDLDLDAMTFIYEPNPYLLEIYRMGENELPMSRFSKVIV